MSLVLISVGLMLFLSLFSVLMGSSWAQFDINPITLLTDPGDWTWDEFMAFYQEARVGYGIGQLEGALVLLAVFLTLGSIVGIKIFGTGLSDSSVHNITLVLVYTGLWVSLSLLGGALIFQIELFGELLYLSLTIIYVIGVIQKLAGGVE